MRWILYSFLLIALGLTVVAKTPSHAYRLTVEVETPEGVRRGEAVRHVFTPCPGFISTTLLPIGAGPQWMLEGEAVFVDLGAGRNVVALLAHGPKGGDVDQPVTLALDALSEAGIIDEKGADPLTPPPRCKMGHHRGSAVVTGRRIPTLVTFPDLNDPASAQVVYATGGEKTRDASGVAHVTSKVFVDRFAELFGTGVTLKEVRLEMIPAGIWPFNHLPLPFLQSIFGTPVTRGIEARLPWWHMPNRPTAQALRSSGLTTGSSIDAELAFLRK